MKYVSLDLETGGLDKDKVQILEVSAILQDSERPTSYFDSPRLRFLVAPADGTYQVEPFAAAMHHDLWLEINASKDLVPENMINHRIADWCESQGLEKVTFAGKNFATFDLPFLLKRGGTGLIDYRRRTLDPCCMYATKSDLVLPSTEECMKRAGLIPSMAHMALGDAWDVIRLVNKHWGGPDLKSPASSERAEWIRGSVPW